MNSRTVLQLRAAAGRRGIQQAIVHDGELVRASHGRVKTPQRILERGSAWATPQRAAPGDRFLLSTG